MEEVVLVADTGDDFGASPVWDPTSQSLLWCDSGRNDIYRLEHRTGVFHRHAIDRSVMAFARSRRSEWIVASKQGFVQWELGARSTRFIIDPASDRPHLSLAACAIDGAGRCVAGTFNELEPEHADGTLFSLERDGSVRRLDEQLTRPGGMSFSLNSRTLFVTEPALERIIAYEYDPESGNVGDRDLFASVAEEHGAPEGIAVDAEGFVWVAHRYASRLTRWTDYGDIDRVIDLPFASPTALCFGGPYLDELYVTTARAVFSAPPAEDGALFRVRCGARGVLTREFRSIVSN